jgi:hypothetical protein
MRIAGIKIYLDMKHRKLIHCNFSRERIEHEILLVQMTMENWDATHDDEKIEKLIF